MPNRAAESGFALDLEQRYKTGFLSGSVGPRGPLPDLQHDHTMKRQNAMNKRGQSRSQLAYQTWYQESRRDITPTMRRPKKATPLREAVSAFSSNSSFSCFSSFSPRLRW